MYCVAYEMWNVPTELIFFLLNGLLVFSCISESKTLDEPDFTLPVKSPVVELDVDDSDCYNNCMTLLLRLLITRRKHKENKETTLDNVETPRDETQSKHVKIRGRRRTKNKA